jgi:Mn-dependent DtxR family transcriptional regulator
VLGVLARQSDTGERVSEAEIARELGLEPTEVAGILRDLSSTNKVTRTSGGNWELTPAGAKEAEPKPHPKEPQAS